MITIGPVLSCFQTMLLAAGSPFAGKGTMNLRSLCVLGLLSCCATSATAQQSGQESVREFLDPEIQEAEFLFQPPATPAETRPTTPSRAGRRAGFREYASLERVPNMYGDLLGGLLQLQLRDPQGGQFAADLPFGAGRSYKIAENTRPIPTDRIYFNYNHFHNALATAQAAPGIPGGVALGDANLDRYTLGFEKTFFDGNSSIDVRMPFVSDFEATNNAGFLAASGNVGDLSIFFKDLLYADDMVALAAGMGVGIPTGDDVEMQLFSQPLTLNNDAVHLMPYVGAAIVPNDYWFFQMFFEIDFAASGNELSGGPQNVSFGELTEQHLFEASLSGGYWLFDNPDAYYVQGIAAIMELHYTTTIHDADSVFFGLGEVGNAFNRVDFLNLTSGLQFQIGPLSNLRVGCAVPLRTSVEDHPFDAEIQVQFNRFFY